MNNIFRISTISIICFGLIISHLQCQTKKQSTMNIIVPEVSKEFERLEINENYDPSKEISSYSLSDGSYIELEKEPYGYIERRWAPDSYFIIIKQFYENKNIKEKGVIFNSGYFKIGIWYYFNESNQLIKEENCDLDFTFSFQELFDHLQKNNIPVTKGHIELYSGHHTSITKRIDSNKSMWIVNWLKEPQLEEEIYINGNNGSEIKTEEIFIRENK